MSWQSSSNFPPFTPSNVRLSLQKAFQRQRRNVEHVTRAEKSCSPLISTWNRKWRTSVKVMWHARRNVVKTPPIYLTHPSGEEPREDKRVWNLGLKLGLTGGALSRLWFKLTGFVVWHQLHDCLLASRRSPWRASPETIRAKSLHQMPFFTSKQWLYLDGRLSLFRSNYRVALLCMDPINAVNAGPVSPMNRCFLIQASSNCQVWMSFHDF